MTKNQAIKFLLEQPYLYGHILGFDKLTLLHNAWIKDMVCNSHDRTLQAHRGSYKTTCVAVSLALIMILLPRLKIAFFRKTEGDVKEVIKEVSNILKHPATNYFVRTIYGKDIALVEESSGALTTNLVTGVKGTSQLTGLGTTASLTGKHYDRIFTDDIVNLRDRVSRAERERTKLIYQELQNLINRPNGRIYNTGTPWHKDDCFSIMPEARMYDCYSTGLMTEDEIKDKRSKMTASLFAANYELRHIAAEDVIFESPKTGYDPELVKQGIAHIDAAYYGEDYTAFTVMKRVDDVFYVYGRLWRKHVEDVEDVIIQEVKNHMAGPVYNELNADKGYLAKDLRKKGQFVRTYTESMNKFIKITSYLKDVWDKVYFVKGTDAEYIDQICDYNENAEHDDAPDSCASCVRILWKKPENYTPLWN